MNRYRLAIIAMILVWGWAAPSAYVFIPGNPRWPAGEIVMHLQAGSFTPGLIDGSASWNQSAEFALADWNNHIVSSFFTVVRDSTIPIFELDGRNSVYFSDTVFGRSFGGAAATTTRWVVGSTRTEADVVFNTAFNWNSYRGNLRPAEGGGTLQDFRRIALHEFGHVLGLDHPNQQGQNVVAIMNSSASNTDRLQVDDINGGRALYPGEPICSYGLSASGASVPAAGAPGAVSVFAAAGCNWAAINNSPPMLAITSGSSGTGNGTVTFQVFANPSSSPRVGTLTIAGITFTITQPGGCAYALTASGTGVTAAATAGAVNVITTAGCPWTAVSNSPSMVTITEGPSGSGNGIVRFAVSANTSASQRVGSLTIAGLLFSIAQAARPPYRPSDIDGDGRSELVVWRPSTGRWYWLTSSLGYSTSRAGEVVFGGLGDTPLMGDMDGDGRDDLVVWRGSTGTFYWTRSSTNTIGTQQLGHQSVGDIPMLADMDGDGRADLVVWRPSTGVWYWSRSSSGYTAVSSVAFGGAGDVPLLADMDGDGRSDLIVWRGSTGTFFWLNSSNNQVLSRQWGVQGAGDVPLVGDLDGDRKGDLVVWRTPTGRWYCLTSTTGHNTLLALERSWGSQSTGDVPSLADRDGDGKADITVWRSSTGTWYWLQSTTGFSGGLAMQWGISTDVPIVR